MSFYSYKNANPNCCPGTISGSALDGLQEKVCVQVKRVYDSAMTQEQLTKQTVTITSYAQVNNTCTCNACGCCSYVCPARRDLVTNNKLAKRFLASQPKKEVSKS